MLLIGGNSTTNIAVGDSVGAILRAIAQANRELADGTRQRLDHPGGRDRRAVHRHSDRGRACGQASRSTDRQGAQHDHRRRSAASARSRGAPAPDVDDRPRRLAPLGGERGDTRAHDRNRHACPSRSPIASSAPCSSRTMPTRSCSRRSRSWRSANPQSQTRRIARSGSSPSRTARGPKPPRSSDSPSSSSA